MKSSRSRKIMKMLNISHRDDAKENNCHQDISNEEKENIPLSSSANYVTQEKIANNTLPSQNNPLVETDTVPTTILKRISRSSSSSSTSSSSSSNSSSSSSSSSSFSRSCSLEKVQCIQVKKIATPPQSLLPNATSTSILTPPVILTPRSSAVNYLISPINSEESADISDNDPTYTENQSKKRWSSSSSNSSDNNTSEVITTSPTKKFRKRKADPTKWKQNNQKIKRNLGEQYISTKTKNCVPARQMKRSCNDKCRLKCSEKFDENKRLQQFKCFWALGDLHLQRMFISARMGLVEPKYKYTNAEHPRTPNASFYLHDENTKIRVCKTFFINTLGITSKMIRTVRHKTNNCNAVEEDRRGKHNKHKRVDQDLKDDIIRFINSIPRIESHYLRASTSREFISGSKSITDLFKDFQKRQKNNSRESGKFHLFYDIFTTHFNLGFFQPKKDQCDLCLQYKNSISDQKLALKPKYDTHVEQKELSREEKRNDRKNIDNYNLLVCYDVQAIMQSPNGQTSSFYYKSKLNSYNFTLTMLNKLPENKSEADFKSYGDVHCYFWDETQGKRGATEIGSCVLNFLKDVCEDKGEHEVNITFVTDNCCGQNKNKFIASLYLFAVTTIKNLNSITHKFLIKGHTQNEADNVHMLIQKQISRDLKAGPIFTPLQYINAIQRARKTGKPFTVHTLNYDFFYNLKDLQENWGYNFNIDEEKNTTVWNDIKVMKFIKGNTFSFQYKTSYKDEFKQINVRNKRKRMLDVDEIISIKRAYSAPFDLSLNKKQDLKELISKRLIDPYHACYYTDMLM